MAKASKKIGRPNAADLLINVLKKAEQDHQIKERGNWQTITTIMMIIDDI